MNTKELRRLKQWLEIKMGAIDNSISPNTDEYSDANLSIEILRYIQHCINKEIRLEEDRQREVTQWYPDPFFNNYPYSEPEEKICKLCKTTNPLGTHCIHKIKL